MCIPGQEPLTASRLAAAPLHEQKQMIGEWLAPLLWSRDGGMRARSPGGKPRVEVKHKDKVQLCCCPACWMTLPESPLPYRLCSLKTLSDQMVLSFHLLCCSVTLT